MKQKHKNITLSFPYDLHLPLHSHVQNRKISSYVSNTERKALKTDKKLEDAYEKANKDPDRKKVITELEAMDQQNDSNGWDW